MAALAGTFGIAVPNFTAYPQMPDAKALVALANHYWLIGAGPEVFTATSVAALSNAMAREIIVSATVISRYGEENRARRSADSSISSRRAIAFTY